MQWQRLFLHNNAFRSNKRKWEILPKRLHPIHAQPQNTYYPTVPLYVGSRPVISTDNHTIKASFFPEGGHLVNNHSQNIGIYLYNTTNQPIETNYWILKNGVDTIYNGKTSHSGLSIAAFTPEKMPITPCKLPKTSSRSKFQVQNESQPFKPLFTKTDLFVVFYPRIKKTATLLYICLSTTIALD